MKGLATKAKQLIPVVFLSLPTVLFDFPQSASAQSSAPPATIQNVNNVIENAISAIIVFVGVASLGMLLLGGYRYLSAGPDKKAASLAQQTINYAVGGLIVSLCSWLILSFIGNALGINLNTFEICITPNCV